jgi:hypothetical protein
MYNKTAMVLNILNHTEYETRTNLLLKQLFITPKLVIYECNFCDRRPNWMRQQHN